MSEHKKPLTQEYLTEVRQRAQASTEGDWWAWHREDELVPFDTWAIFPHHGFDPRSESLAEVVGQANAELIACARRDILALLDELERQQQEVRRLRQLLQEGQG